MRYLLSKTGLLQMSPRSLVAIPPPRRAAAFARKKLLVAAASFALMAPSAHAQGIIGYDITNARPSGFGSWSHTYTGSITAPVNGLSNYSGGGGTMNDWTISNSGTDNQLFKVSDNSVITLYLSGTFQLSSLTIFGGIFENANPGAITGATIGFGGGLATLTSTPINDVCFNYLCDDLFTFAGTSLAGLSGNTITLSNIQSVQQNFNISEISVSGTPLAPVTAVPEPSSFALFGFGFATVLFAVRNRKRV